jgi:hypothetical protein
MLVYQDYETTSGLTHADSFDGYYTVHEYLGKQTWGLQ